VATPVPVPAAPAPTPAPAPVIPPAAPAPTGKTITLKASLTVKELATELGIRPNQLIAELMHSNVLASMNEKLDPKLAQKIAEKHGFNVLREEKKAAGHILPKSQTIDQETLADDPQDLVPRPPIVTFMGHVDHGKTSLLDRIRNATVAQGEHGGITQHIGAYTVQHGKQLITFLDTPGHEAFTAMRARGANLTDIAVIIVAADDGLMPQTREAILHAQAAKVTLMVAINKCDLPTANPQRVRQQLAAEGMTTEDWGGTLIACDVSAVTGEGLDKLLEMILLQSEILELRANPKRRAKGFVIEARLEPGTGPTANLLIRQGTIHVGDIILAGLHTGRVRALINDRGERIREAGPSMPVKCLGLSGVPDAGSDFSIFADEKEARIIAAERQAQSKAEQLVQPKRLTMEALLEQALTQGDKIELSIILKTDVQGSLEAIQHALMEIKSEKITLRILMAAVGNINTNDVLLADASSAIILGFHVSADEEVNRLAKQHGVDIRLHSIIYELVDQVRDCMTGRLAPIIKEKIMGHAVIKQVFELSKGGHIAGCGMKDGSVTPKMRVRVKRGGDVVYEGSINSLRRFQNDVSEVRENQECGIRLDNFTAFAENDILEFYLTEKIAQAL
jgi:translation initiation factor IF-2